MHDRSGHTPPASGIKERLATAGELLGGFAILCAFLFAGIWLKKALHLIVPGNVLGLFLILGAMASGIVKLRHFELASKWLLFFMPMLFVPIYVGAGAYKAIWVQWGWLLAPSMIVAVIAMWVFVGHFAQWILSGRPKPATEGKQ